MQKPTGMMGLIAQPRFPVMVSLFQSFAFGTIRTFVLKNPTYAEQELRQLAAASLQPPNMEVQLL
jgi:hypothetical protein